MKNEEDKLDAKDGNLIFGIAVAERLVKEIIAERETILEEAFSACMANRENEEKRVAEMNNSPTPETDAAEKAGIPCGHVVLTPVDKERVCANFARKLERERDGLKAALSALSKAYLATTNRLTEDKIALEKECEKLREKNAELIHPFAD